MPRPRVSVIMPAFNRQQTIAYAIESVLNQRFGDFELILIDDASADATHEIMQFYRSCDERVVVASNSTNSRDALIEWEPRNDGLKIARGRLIAYLDSDNLWNRDFLSLCTQAFEENQNAYLVHCNSQNHYQDRSQYELVLQHDKRTLLEYDAAKMTAVFSYRGCSHDNGVAWYIDTNEMMHRADVFRELHYLWATRHPQRQKINDAQLVRCVYRRHNDQELAERIIQRFGQESVVKLEDVLVEFFYAPRQREILTLRYEPAIRDIIENARASRG